MRRDLLDAANVWRILQGFRPSELIAMSKRAAEFYKNDVLPLGESEQ